MTPRIRMELNVIRRHPLLDVALLVSAAVALGMGMAFAMGLFE